MIRKAEKRDREAYLEMAKDFYSSEAVLHDIPSENIERTFDECMKSDIYAELYIIENEKETEGYGLIAKTFSQEAGGMVIWLEELFVKPEYRSRGLGSEYFSFIGNSFPEAKRFRLEVEEYNKRAVKLYNKLGYSFLDYRQMIKES